MSRGVAAMQDEALVQQPRSIVHGYDVGCNADGSFEYVYNFLVYTFELGGDLDPLMARSYLDEIGSVSVSTHPSQLIDERHVACLAFLQLRYRTVMVFGNDGYEPLPGELAKRVADRVEAFYASQVLAR